MSFKLTYASMFEPPAELHTRFAAAVERVSARLGGQHRLYVGGQDRPADQYFLKTNPADTTQLLGDFPAASVTDADAAMKAAAKASPSWKRTPVAERA